MIKENYRIYFAEFGELVTFTGSTAAKDIVCIWNREVISSFMGGMNSENYEVSCVVKTAEISNWVLNSTVKRNGITYYVVGKALLDNENLSLLELSKDKVE